jgi:excisionase family DNA binding protein
MKLLKPDEAAAYTRFKKQTLYSYVHQRKIPYLKIGKSLLFITEELDTWILNGATVEAALRILSKRKTKI